jgi:preprotein translocase subunit SecA
MLWRYSHFIERQRLTVWKERSSLLTETVPAGVLQERVPEEHERARGALGEAALRDLERGLMLQAIDECWSEHLATVTEIRDGIHLVELGGLSPLEEFQKAAAQSFIHVMKAIQDRVVDRFRSLEIGSDGVDWETAGIRGPSSTWTYLVDDDAFTDGLAAALSSRRNIGFQAGAAFTGPLLMLWGLSRLLRRRGKH